MNRLKQQLAALVVVIAGCDAGQGDADDDSHQDWQSDTTTQTPPADELGEWVDGPSLQVARFAHTLTAVSGELFAVGGWTGLCPGDAPAQVTGALERWSAGSDWTIVAEATPRARHTTTQLPDGTLLIVGGVDAEGQPLDIVERFDPGSNLVTTQASLLIARSDHVAALVGSDRLLVVGGRTLQEEGHRTAELVNLTTGETRDVSPNMPAILQPTGAVELGDGSVFVIDRDLPTVFDADSEQWRATAAAPNWYEQPGAAGLGSGMVAVVASAETGRFTEAGPVVAPMTFVYDPAADTWTQREEAPFAGTLFAGVTLADGRALLGHETQLYIFDAEDGWGARLPGAPHAFAARAVGPEGVVYLAGGTGNPNCTSVGNTFILDSAETR